MVDISEAVFINTFPDDLTRLGVKRQDIEVRAFAAQRLAGTNIDKAFIFAPTSMPYSNSALSFLQVQVKYGPLILARRKVEWYLNDGHLKTFCDERREDSQGKGNRDNRDN